jgi:hypothetical protein
MGWVEVARRGVAWCDVRLPWSRTHLAVVMAVVRELERIQSRRNS